jgi:hypothetical protein
MRNLHILSKIIKKLVKFTGKKETKNPKISQFFWSKNLRKIDEKKHWMESSIFQQSICDCDFHFIKPKETIPTRYSKFPTMKGQKEQGGKKKTPTGGSREDSSSGRGKKTKTLPGRLREDSPTH